MYFTGKVRPSSPLEPGEVSDAEDEDDLSEMDRRPTGNINIIIRLLFVFITFYTMLFRNKCLDSLECEKCMVNTFKCKVRR